MRIISGNFKGSSLHITKEKTTRPLKDMVRENIFNLLTHSNKIPLKFKESIILDLYSGTGSFGLECLSRNAKKVYFVENEKSAFQVLKKNIDKLKIKLKTEVFFYDVFGFLEKENILGLKFDIIFIDPPYKNKNMENLLILINKKKVAKKKWFNNFTQK